MIDAARTVGNPCVPKGSSRRSPHGANCQAGRKQQRLVEASDRHHIGASNMNRQRLMLDDDSTILADI
jgi:hypothetical protein